MVIHPRVPIISVEYAHLDLLKYDIVRVMQMQLTIVIRTENDNAKAPALFDETNFKLSYEVIPNTIQYSNDASHRLRG
uniref:Uncharacterized protein n=1 Tax=Brassica oleracea TaxID=3712 RepID=A0A3P6CS95_BRAOL|nr:unnamed protein product [Brassica oleracea]